MGTRAWEVSGKTSVVQLLSHFQLFATPWTAAHQASQSLTISGVCSDSCPLSPWYYLTIILCHSLPLLPSIFPSISFFPSEMTVHIRWPKYFSFSFSLSPSNEYSGLTSFRIDWFDSLAVQGTLKSLLQHHSFKASVLRHAAFFMVLLSRPYMTTGKNHSFDYMDLCQQTDVSAF